MKKLVSVFIGACLFASAQVWGQNGNAPQRQPVDKAALEQQYGLPISFPIMFQGPASNNTGVVYMGMIKASGNNMVTNFLFTPGSRNYWHHHPDAEQALLVLEGEAYYQEEGQPKRLLKKGDYVVTPANTKHWNGATENGSCVCITISEKNDKDHAFWYGPVTDEEFTAK